MRNEVNRWIRTSGAFDWVADFDKVLRDPADPAGLRARYDRGDHLHPNEAGYQAIADAVSPWPLAGLAIVGGVTPSAWRLLPSGMSPGEVAQQRNVLAKTGDSGRANAGN